jgi:hypothetical protein
LIAAKNNDCLVTEFAAKLISDNISLSFRIVAMALACPKEPLIMKTIHYFAAIPLILLTALHTASADSIEKDLITICGWYHSLATEDKYKHFTAEDKFNFVFDQKTQLNIKYASMRMYYSALRTTEASQRYELMQAYAEGILGKDWECQPMKAIMQEFNSLDRYFQYSQN